MPEFHARLYYGQTVRAELRLAEIGRTSLSWNLSVRGPDDVVAITAEAVVVHAPGPSAAPWPEAVRAKLAAVRGVAEEGLEPPTRGL